MIDGGGTEIGPPGLGLKLWRSESPRAVWGSRESVGAEVANKSSGPALF